MDKNLNSKLIDGHYHYMTFLTSSKIIDGCKITWHNSIMVLSAFSFSTGEIFFNAVRTAIEAQKMSHSKFIDLELSDAVWDVSVIECFDTTQSLRNVQKQCSFTILAI